MEGLSFDFSGARVVVTGGTSGSGHGVAYAFDAWQARQGGAQVFGRSNPLARQHYLGLCYFTEARSEAVAELFSPASVDVLRVGTTHAALGSDEIGPWIDRLAAGGVVVVEGLRGTAGSEVWTHIRERLGAGCALEKSNVGVAIHGEHRPGELIGLLADPDQHRALDEFYEHVGNSHTVAARVAAGASQGRAKPR